MHALDSPADSCHAAAFAAAAFLVGGFTVLPALSSFCIFAGMGIVLCFLLQVFLFIPCLALDAKRAESGRFDCCCLCKAGSTVNVGGINEPQGCCTCCSPCQKKSCFCGGTFCTTPGKLADFLENKFGVWITSGTGVVVTLLVFGGLLIAGSLGAGLMYKDFQIEWFVPDDSYVKSYIDLNNQYFKTGKSFTIYTPSVNYIDKKTEVAALSNYLATSPTLVDQTAGVDDWCLFLNRSHTAILNSWHWHYVDLECLVAC